MNVSMLTLYKRRHDDDCLRNLVAKGLISSTDPKKLGKSEKKFLVKFYDCRCAYWVRGTNDHGKKFEAQSLKVYTRDAAAIKLKELNQPDTPEAVGMTVAKAAQAWIAEQHLLRKSDHTIWVYQQTVGFLIDICTRNGVTEIAKVTQLLIQQMRAEWVTGTATLRKVGNNTHRNRMGWLQGFFSYCQRNGWVRENLAKLAPKVPRPRPDDEEQDEATMPLDLDGTETNYRNILAAVHPYFAGEIGLTKPSAERARAGEKHSSNRRTLFSPLAKRPDHYYALLELMFHTGLRISDAIHFDFDGMIVDEACGTYTTIQKKTGKPVTCYLPLWLVNKFAALERISPRYIFFDGRKSWKSYINSCVEPYLSRIGDAAGVEGVRAHRFRDSFAVNRLNRGMRLEDVQKLLGHSSIRTTERYYAPFVKSRQDRLKGLVTSEWAAVEGKDRNVVQISVGKNKKRRAV
jgi:integrase/recombinase XerD